MESRILDKSISTINDKAKAYFASWSTVYAPPAALFVFFATDTLIMGTTGDPYASHRFGNLSMLWDCIHLGNCFVLDCFLLVVLLGLLAFQFIRCSKVRKFATEDAHRKRNAFQKITRHGIDGAYHGEAGYSARRNGKIDCATGGVPRVSQVGQVERLNVAIDAAARQGDSAEAARLLLEFQKQGKGCCKPDSVSYNLVIRACAKQGDLKGAERWFSHMEAESVEATLCSYNTVLDACAKTGNCEACESWLQKMLDKGIRPSIISYATAIYARARRGDEAMAEVWFRKMIAAGIEPDAVCYNSMIHACSVTGHAAAAEHWLQEMQAKGLDPTVTTFTAMIGACAKAFDVARAETWLDAMIAADVRPNVVSFTSMIDACAKACEPARAEHWHKRMMECGIEPNAHSFSAVINAYAKAGNVAMAERWLHQAEEGGVANDSVLYSSVIDACGKCDDAERAMGIFRRMQSNGIQPHIVAYASLARPFSYRGDWVTVESISREMIANRIVANEYFVYAQLLSYALAEPRQASKAENCFRDALLSGLRVNDHVIRSLCRAVGRQRCASLMRELCEGRAVPRHTSRR